MSNPTESTPSIKMHFTCFSCKTITDKSQYCNLCGGNSYEMGAAKSGGNGVFCRGCGSGRIEWVCKGCGKKVRISKANTEIDEPPISEEHWIGLIVLFGLFILGIFSFWFFLSTNQ